MVLLFLDVLGGAGSDTECSSNGESGSDDDGDEEEEDNDEEDGEMKIQDETQMNMMALRRTIYLTIMSSLSVEECAHKILQMSIKPGQEVGGARISCIAIVFIKFLWTLLSCNLNTV